MVMADLPQGNDIAGILRYNANLGCRSCKATKNELSNISFDIYSNGRYHQITDKEFQDINREQTNTARFVLNMEYDQYQVHLYGTPSRTNFKQYSQIICA